MSHNYIIIFILFFLNSFQLFSQKTTVKWGPEYKKSTRSAISKIIGEDEKGMYVLKEKIGFYSANTVILERYDKKMSQVFSKELTIPEQGVGKMIYEGIFYINKQLVLLSSYVNKEQKKNYAFAHLISSSGEIQPEFQKLAEVDFEKNNRPGGFTFTMSNDSSKFLVHINSPYDRKDNEKFSYKVFDASLSLIWEKNMEIPYSDKYTTISNYNVDNTGNVYMILTKYPDKSKGEKAERNTQAAEYMVTRYNYQTETFKKYKIDLGEKWVESISYDINEKTNELAVAGFYSKDKYNSIAGIFYTSIDLETEQQKVVSLKPFDKEFLSLFMNERKAEKGKELRNFYFDYFFLKKSGGALLIAERYYVTTHTSTDSQGNTRTYTIYHYDDLIVANVNSKGDIEWIRKVPKRSGAKDGGYYLSYAVLYNEERESLQILFNDNPKNITRLKEDPDAKAVPMKNVKKSVATLVSIEDGFMKRKPLFEAKDAKTILKPNFYLQTSNNSLITLGIKGNKYRFGEFLFE